MVGFLPDPQPLSFLAYVAERHAVLRRRRAGRLPPWSADPVIAGCHLGNVFRDDDRTSVEAREYLATLAADQALRGALVFRWVNWVDTLRELMTLNDWTSGAVRSTLERRKARGDKVFGASAYRINTPLGLWRLDGVAQVMSRLAASSWEPLPRARDTMVELFRVTGSKSLFVVYQTALDLRWLRGSYEDDNTWAFAGPGAERGAERVLGRYQLSSWQGRASKHVGKQVDLDTDLDPPEWLMRVMTELLPDMREALGESVNLHDVEGALCGWDKYCRVFTGESPGRRYRPRP